MDLKYKAAQIAFSITNKQPNADISNYDPDGLINDCINTPVDALCETLDIIPNLSLICRYLLKTGEKALLALAYNIANTLYAVERASGKDTYLSYLYKGIARIGTGDTEIGVRSILAAINTNLSPIDAVYAYWALTSANIINRDMSMALKYANKWLEEANKSSDKNETTHAQIALIVLYMLVDNSQEYERHINELENQTDWKDLISFINGWKDAIDNSTLTQYTSPLPFTSPYPLLVGYGYNNLYDEFTKVCVIRRNCSSKASLSALSDIEIEEHIRNISKWELNKTYRLLMEELKSKDSDKYLNQFLKATIGKELTEITACKCSDTPHIEQNGFIWLMDIRGFSTMSEKETPKAIFGYLNHLFKIINEAFENSGGTIIEFRGDCVIIVFNAICDIHCSIEDILSRTIKCIQRINVLNSLQSQLYQPQLSIGVGINKGECGIGYIGSMNRCQLTVLGNHVNVTARIESLTKEFPGAVLIEKACLTTEAADFWKEPQSVNFSIRYVGNRQINNINKHVSLFSVDPLLQCWIDFVPMGFVAKSEQGVIYIDTGNSEDAGIIDHHTKNFKANSASELLFHNPKILLNHIDGLPSSQIEFRLHELPDLDCAACLYCAYELMSTRGLERRNFYREKELGTLVDYATKIDQGAIPNPQDITNSLYGIFYAHIHITLKNSTYMSTHKRDLLSLEAGLRVIDAAMYLLEYENKYDSDLSNIFYSKPEWFKEERDLLRKDLQAYKEDKRQGHEYEAQVKGKPNKVFGLWLDHPKSLLFKTWAENDPDAPEGKGYKFLTTDSSQGDKLRFVIRVAPDSGTSLDGLGLLLEQAETDKRAMLNKQRPTEPIRLPSDNSDPWYFGWAHGYTIIDSPRNGTVLTAKEVEEIHKKWKI
ncbi:Adenylyl cyclase class-3/4/guanylyl cyclase domain protein [Candidatus Magnetoovum chiemensis]|nr:Adenylyl cyclase class-3/4/guanylyl cyclase domain protein [Candidatus Magnetoovum chiemensis]